MEPTVNTDSAMAKELTALCDEAISAAISDAAQLKFVASHKWHMTLVALYLSILEYGKAAHALAVSQSGAAIPLILRSVLEAYVDLANLARQQSYGHYIEAEHAKQWIYVLKEAPNGNPYLEEIAQAANAEAVLEEHESELKRLVQAGYSPLPQREKFTRAGLGDEYTSVYNFLCCLSHNNMRALISRHIRFNESAGKPELRLFGNFEEGFTVLALDMLLALLFQASDIIYGALECKFEAALPALQEKLKRVREEHGIQA